MSQSTYSWMGSPIHLVLRDEIADTFNRAQEAFFEAQREAKTRLGRDWNPLTDALHIAWTEEEQRVWNTMGDIINKIIEMNGEGLAIPEEKITSDFLVKL